MVNMNICKNKIVKNIKDSNGNIIIGIYVILSGCKVFDYITFGLSRNIGKSVVLVRPGWSYLFIFVNTLLRKQEVLKYMGEVMICRGGRGSGSGGGSYNKKLVTEYITETIDWAVPTMIDYNIKVILVGGGGGAGFVYSTISGSNNYLRSGGGGGWLANGYISNISEGQMIRITIGNGGTCTPSGYGNTYLNGNSGGVTSFGTYLSANGGSGGICADTYYSGGSGGAGGYGNTGGIGYQFGGGGGWIGRGGNGGTWGGGGGSEDSEGGHGGVYGGGGGGGGKYYNGGNGGTYGGGGGGSGYSGNGGNGGTYGGNGGNKNTTAEDGTNTIGWTNTIVFEGKYITGNGSSGKYNNGLYCGGGGFGGNGGNGVINHGGGGGGYGGNGGDGSDYGGGGGGGFMSNGYTPKYESIKGLIIGGGGGGYGKEAAGYGGGGGYRQPGNVWGGGGAYGYGDGAGNNDLVSTDLITAISGKQGVCILQYYVKA